MRGGATALGLALQLGGAGLCGGCWQGPVRARVQVRDLAKYRKRVA